MKKIVIISAMMLCATVSLAQTYDNLDTVSTRYPYYLYNFYDEHLGYGTLHDDMLCYIGSVYNCPSSIWDSLIPYYGGCGSFVRRTFNEVAIGFIPDSTVRIIGFAFMKLPPAGSNNYDYIIPTPWRHDSILNSDAECHFNVYDRDMQLLQTKTVVNRNLHPARVMLNGTFNYVYPHALHYEPCYEVFFDNPIDISDTFYLSETVTYGDSAMFSDINFIAELHYYPEDTLQRVFDSSCAFRLPEELRRYRNDIVNGAWESDIPFDGHMFNIYPIIERPGDTCGLVRNIRYDSVAPGFVLLRWQSLPNQSHWEVSYGPAGTPPGEGRTAVTGIAQLALANLSPDTQYVAYVRAQCKMARTVWTDWSDSISVCLGGSGGSQSIADIESSALQVDITPNPASGMVEVRCSEPMALLELFNAAGDKVFSQQLSTFNFQFSIFNFPSGTYLVRITTPQGVTTRKLVKR